MKEEPSHELILQRIRNRIMEYLDLASSFDDQAEYQANAPGVHVPNEIINQWEVWISPDWQDWLVAPIFDHAEREAVGRYHAVWDDVSDKTPDSLPSLQVLFRDPQWQRLRDAAKETLTVFQRRGPFLDDVYAF